MNSSKKRRVEFGDFQTPDSLAAEVCSRLVSLGYSPDVVIEPTCGVGAFILAAGNAFPSAKKIVGFEVNDAYLSILRERVSETSFADVTRLENADFFKKNWQSEFSSCNGNILIIGNLPWVTNSTQGAIGGENLPEKSNFLKHNGLDAITGKANFDISEWMLLELFRCLRGRKADIAILVKSAVARKILSHLENQSAFVSDAAIYFIDAKRNFDASVDACLLVVRLSESGDSNSHDYTVYDSLESIKGKRVGHRSGLTICDLEAYESLSSLIGNTPEKWRSGVKHDASSVMELTKTPEGLKNGRGELADLEETYIFPLLKGSDIGSGKPWRQKYVLVTQRAVGESTEPIRKFSPKTWAYLEAHQQTLDSRASTIYKKSPRFSVFGVGAYAFKPWKVAICSLYKSLNFRLIGPIEGKPVMFDDTIYYLSFESETEANSALCALSSEPVTKLLQALIFWDDKRPIKTSVLNIVDWTRVSHSPKRLPQLEMTLTGL